jgi:Mrp family chromosome partitioning ATPase
VDQDRLSAGPRLADQLRIFRRRGWTIAITTLLVAGSALAFSLQQADRFEASADVLLTRQNLAAQVQNAPDNSGSQDPARQAETQAELAREPEVALRALRELGGSTDVKAFLNQSTVEPRAGTDILEFTVEAPAREYAIEASTAYAAAFVAYRQELDTSAIRLALEGVEANIAQLEAAGDQDSPLFRSLQESAQQLRTLRVLQTSNATLVQRAVEASQIQPRPRRNTALGLLVGLIAGLCLAALREALETRFRSSEELTEQLDLPLLGRLREPQRSLQEHEQLVMLADPHSVEAEQYRQLRATLGLASLGHQIRLLMVTSALPREGKSTTAANLAIALALAGRRVALVDLDLRRPFVARFFGLERKPGVTHVALGQLSADEALVEVSVTPVDGGADDDGDTAEAKGSASLWVMPAGAPTPHAGEVVGSSAVVEALDSVAQRVDLVIVDAPPLLPVSDAITLSAYVDGLVVLARLDTMTRGVLKDLQRVLETCATRKLGYVLTGVEEDEPQRYGYGTYSAEPAPVHQ